MLQQFIDSVYPFISHPEFMGVVSGVFASYAHTLLKANGLLISAKANFIFNLVLSSAPFVILALALEKSGMTPDAFFGGLSTAAIASQAAYHLLVKKEADGSIDVIEQPAVIPMGSDLPPAAAAAAFDVPVEQVPLVLAPATDQGI